MFHNPLLLLIGVPIAGGVLCFYLSDRLGGLVKISAFLIALASLGGSVFIFINKPLSWQTGSSVIFLADNLSGFIGIGIAAFAFLITIYSFGFIRRFFGRYFGSVLITLGSSFGVVFANDLVMLSIFWGILAVMLYVFVNISGTDKASAAAKKAMVIIGGTDAFMILGIGLIWFATGTFSIEKIHLELNSPANYIAYLSLAIAGFAKAGAIPFHSWLPDVAQDGPTPVTAYLPASLDKLLGIYLIIRASLGLFVMNGVSNLILCAVGSVTIVLAVIVALVQHDMKRLLGYHAVSQVGYMVLGIGTGNPIGIAGGLFHMLNNAIYKSCLFLTGGSVEKRTGTTDLSSLGGLAKYMPVTFVCFLIAALSISGVPPFNGFVSKWMIYQGIIESANPKNSLWIIWLTAAIFGSALTLASFMKLLHAIFLGRPSKDTKDVSEVGFSMTFPAIILAAACVIFGVFAFKFPIPVFIAPSIKGVITFLGAWNPIIAAILIMAGIAAGIFIYAMSGQKSFRETGVFIGGEDQELLERASGTEFYDTIKEIKVLKWLYKKEDDKAFDVYDAGTKGTFFFTNLLRWLHNGILPTYMVWCLLGMLALFYLLMR